MTATIKAATPAAAIIAAHKEAAAKSRALQTAAEQEAARKEYAATPIIPKEVNADTLTAAAHAVVNMKAAAAERRENGLDPAKNPWRLYREDITQEAAVIIMEVMNARREAAREAARAAYIAAMKAGQTKEAAKAAAQEAARKTPNPEAVKYGSAERAVFAHIGSYVYRTYERHSTKQTALEHIAETTPAAPFERRFIDRETARQTEAALLDMAAEYTEKGTKNGKIAAHLIRKHAAPLDSIKQEVYRARRTIESDAADIIRRDVCGTLCIA